MKKIKIIGYMLRYEVGTIVEMEEYKAESLVKAGIAEYTDSKVTKEPESEKVVKAKK